MADSWEDREEQAAPKPKSSFSFNPGASSFTFSPGASSFVPGGAAAPAPPPAPAPPAQPAAPAPPPPPAAAPEPPTGSADGAPAAADKPAGGRQRRRRSALPACDQCCLLDSLHAILLHLRIVTAYLLTARVCHLRRLQPRRPQRLHPRHQLPLRHLRLPQPQQQRRLPRLRQRPRK